MSSTAAARSRRRASVRPGVSARCSSAAASTCRSTAARRCARAARSPAGFAARATDSRSTAPSGWRISPRTSRPARSSRSRCSGPRWAPSWPRTRSSIRRTIGSGPRERSVPGARSPRGPRRGGGSARGRGRSAPRPAARAPVGGLRRSAGPERNRAHGVRLRRGQLPRERHQPLGCLPLPGWSARPDVRPLCRPPGRAAPACCSTPVSAVGTVSSGWPRSPEGSCPSASSPRRSSASA